MRKFNIAFCKNRKDLVYTNQYITWSDFANKLSKTTYTHETIEEYRALPKSRQADIKDVGGFVAGYLKGGRRGRDTIDSRSMISLDLDEANLDFVEEMDMLDGPGYAMIIYSTHKHTNKKPKLRLIIPLDRDVNPDEYEFLSRSIAKRFNDDMLWFDDTTYQPSRMMYWPSTSKDGEYLFRQYDDSLFKVDEFLSKYPNWGDVSTWPHSERTESIISRELKKLGNQADKKGWIGTFNRTYSIQDAISKFIPDVYTPTDKSNRWTYVNGSTAGGLVIYPEDNAAYSNHSTDPAGNGHAHNAFDLIRIHKFGYLDADVKEGTSAVNMPSYKAMIEMLQGDKETKITFAKEQEAELQSDFAEELNGDGDFEWTANLDRDKNGNCKPTINNASLIMNHDPNLSDIIVYDEFASLMVSVKDLPWRKVDHSTRVFNDKDMASLRLYIERKYNLTGKGVIEDAFMDYLQHHKIHPVREYLKGLVWDGVERAETIFIRFLGAEDTKYTRLVTRTFLRAAVMRILHPGIKFDNMPILIGPQGMGKSTILARLGGRWFTDSLKDFKGKEAMELIQGTWISEIGELAAMKKAEVEDIKQFLSSTEDKFRPAYGRKAELFPRQCVMIGTSNKPDIFRDMTGNRRFWPIDLVKDNSKKADFFDNFNQEYVDQVWAEVMTWKDQKLYLPYEMDDIVEQIQKDHLETNINADKIRDYLDTPLPEDWETWDFVERQAYYNDPEKIEILGVKERTKVSIKEIMAELFNTPEYKIDNYRAKEYCDIIRSFDDWEYKVGIHFYKPYGRGRGFRKKSLLSHK